MIGILSIHTSKRSLVKRKTIEPSKPEPKRTRHTHSIYCYRKQNNSSSRPPPTTTTIYRDECRLHYLVCEPQPRWWWHAMTQFHYNNVQEHVTNFRSNGATTTAYLLFSANNAMNASTNISMSHVTNPPTKPKPSDIQPTNEISLRWLTNSLIHNFTQSLSLSLSLCAVHSWWAF